MAESDRKTELGGGTQGAPAVPLEHAFELWQKANAPAPRSVEGYRYALRQFARHGFVSTEDVTLVRLTNYLAGRAEKVKRATVLREWAMFSALLGALEMHDLYPLERLVRIRRLRPRRLHREELCARFLSCEEIVKLCSSARAVGARCELLVRLGLLTGLRAKELARVHTQEMHLGARSHLLVRIVNSLGNDGTIKTHRERRVPLCREAVDLLHAQPVRDGYVFQEELEPPMNRGECVMLGCARAPKARGLCDGHYCVAKQAVAAGRTTWRDLEDEGRAYLRRDGRGVNQHRRRPFARRKTLWRDLRRAAYLAGIEDLTFHTLRHTRASTWVAAGVPLAKVAVWLGHSVEICARYYVGVALGYDPDCELGSTAFESGFELARVGEGAMPIEPARVEPTRVEPTRAHPRRPAPRRLDWAPSGRRPRVRVRVVTTGPSSVEFETR